MTSRNGKAADNLMSVVDNFRTAQNLYRATRQTRFTKRTNQVNSTGTNEDSQYASESDYFRLVELARDLDRNDMVVGQGIGRLIHNVVQSGFTLDPKTGSDGADSLIKYVWDQYSNEPFRVDYEQQRAFSDLERLILRHIVVDGDIVVLPLRTGAIQVVENQRLRTPYGLPRDVAKYTIHGVQLDAGRRRVGYWLTDDDIGFDATPDLNTSKFYPATSELGRKLVHHLYYPRRMSQTRGISRLAPVIDPASMHDDIQFATLVSRQVQSCFTIIRERMPGFEPPEGAEEEFYYEPDPCQPGQTRPLKNMSAGMMYTGYPGETVKGFTPTVPGAAHFDHARQVMEIIAVNLDLPLILFMLDASETNFSAWRGAMDQAKVAFQVFQRWYTSIFHRQIFLWKMRQWSTPGTPLSNPLLVGLRERGVDIFAHEWVHPSWPYIEPLTDASADLLEIRNGLSSPRRIQGRRGRDWDVVSSEIVSDFKQIAEKAIIAAQEIAEAYPELEDPPSWREFARMPMPDGTQMALSQAEIETTETETEEDSASGTEED